MNLGGGLGWTNIQSTARPCVLRARIGTLLRRGLGAQGHCWSSRALCPPHPHISEEETEKWNP